MIKLILSLFNVDKDIELKLKKELLSTYFAMCFRATSVYQLRWYYISPAMQLHNLENSGHVNLFILLYQMLCSIKNLLMEPMEITMATTSDRGVR